MPMSEAGREVLAKHYQVLATLTPEQNAAVNRRHKSRNAASFNGKTERDNLEIICEAEARYGR